jgi:guanosine-3',5'-bis(diphosphate) 3'-pyrophosphohydrolase
MARGIRLVLEAADFAAERHRGQTRKGADAAPYINHPLEVSRVLCEEGGVTDPELIAAALLHDTIEDTPTVYDDLAERFGERVAGLVVELTDDKRLPKQARKLEQVRHAPGLSPGAKLVKLADKLCNLREIIESPPASWSAARRADYFTWSKEVVDGVRGANPALERAFDAVYSRR